MIEIQDAIISVLKAANPTVAFYSYVPEKVDPPYTVVNYPELDENDTDTETGFNADVQIESFSRYRGYNEVSIVNKSIYDSLHRVTMSDTDSYCFSTIHQNFSNIVTDGDGMTRVSVQRFTVIFEPSN